MSTSELQFTDQYISELTLLDDDLMALVFDGNTKATELLLRVILECEDIEVVKVVGQRELKNPDVSGRNIRLDILARDSRGRFIDIEVQRNDEGAHYRRARFHSSMLDVRMLKKGQKFKELLDSYVIFITENDIVGAGLPMYHVGRTIQETRQLFKDGSHIIYVNGSYRGDDPIGKLVHDFRCKNSDEMFYSDLADAVQHFKETGGGRKLMSKIVEEYAELRAKMAVREQQEKMVKNLMETMKIGLDQAMSALKIPEEDRIILAEKISLLK